MPPRLSLTKSQRQTAAGLELISLCTIAGADGRLSDEEVRALKEWADTHRDAELPARNHIAKVLEHILADGIITSAERGLLFDAIETVLPPDVRVELKVPRKQAAAADRSRDKALYHYDFMVAGVRYANRHRVCRTVEPQVEVALCREAGNPFSGNATLVLTPDGRELGYVPEADAQHLARQLDDRCLYEARVKRVLTGGRWPIPIVVARVYWSDAQVPTARVADRVEYVQRPEDTPQPEIEQPQTVYLVTPAPPVNDHDPVAAMLIAVVIVVVMVVVLALAL